MREFQIIFIMTVYNSSFKPLQMAAYTFPWWSVILGRLPVYSHPTCSFPGWFLRLISVLVIPIFAIVYLLSGTGSLSERFRWAITPQQRRHSATSLAADPTQIIDSSLLDPIHTLTPV